MLLAHIKVEAQSPTPMPTLNVTNITQPTFIPTAQPSSFEPTSIADYCGAFSGGGSYDNVSHINHSIHYRINTLNLHR